MDGEGNPLPRTRAREREVQSDRRQQRESAELKRELCAMQYQINRRGRRGTQRIVYASASFASSAVTWQLRRRAKCLGQRHHFQLFGDDCARGLLLWLECD